MAAGVRRQAARDYTKGNLLDSIWRLAVPMTLEMTVSNLFQVVELFFVGALGAASLAAISLAGSVRWVLISLAMGLGVGTAAVVARRIGEKNTTAADHAATQAVAFAIGLGIVLGLLGLFLATPLVRILGAGPDVVPEAVLYLRITFFGLPVLSVSLVLAALLRGAGNANEALWLATVGNVANVMLLPVLVTGLVVPALGVGGAALAGVLAQLIAVSFGIYVIGKGKTRVRLHWRDFSPDWRLIWTMISIGLPSAAQAVLRSSARVAMISLVAPFGTAAIAGYGVATRLTVMLLTPGFGMGNAAGTLVGQNLGAKQPARAARSAWVIAGINLSFMIAAMSLLAYYAPLVATWFNCTPDVAVIAAEAIRVVAIGYAFSSVGVVMGRALDGAGNTMPAMVVNLFTLWGVQVPLGYLLSRFTALGLTGVWVGWGASSIANSLAMAYWFRRGGWKEKKV